MSLQVEGTSECRIDESFIRMRPGQVLLLDPEHDARDIQASDGVRIALIEFDLFPRPLSIDPNSNPHYVARRPASSQPSWHYILGEQPPTPLDAASASIIGPLIAMASRTWWVDRVGRLQATAHICQAVIHLFARYGRSQHMASGGQNPLVKAKRAAEAGIGRGFSVDDMAQVAGMTRSRFSTVWKATFGHSPGLFLRRIRVLQVAAQLHKGYSIERVAIGMGWRDARQMTQYIARASGVTWRKWLREQGI